MVPWRMKRRKSETVGVVGRVQEFWRPVCNRRARAVDVASLVGALGRNTFIASPPESEIPSQWGLSPATTGNWHCVNETWNCLGKVATTTTTKTQWTGWKTAHGEPVSHVCPPRNYSQKPIEWREETEGVRGEIPPRLSPCLNVKGQEKKHPTQMKFRFLSLFQNRELQRRANWSEKWRVKLQSTPGQTHSLFRHLQEYSRKTRARNKREHLEAVIVVISTQFRHAG